MSIGIGEGRAIRLVRQIFASTYLGHRSAAPNKFITTLTQGSQSLALGLVLTAASQLVESRRSEPAKFGRVIGGAGKAALPVSASMTPCAKLSSSVSGSLPNPSETLAITFVVLLKGFWLKRMVELWSKANSAEVFAQGIVKKNREKEILKTYQRSSLIYLGVFAVYLATKKVFNECFVS
jgi:hypothetical protein